MTEKTNIKIRSLRKDFIFSGTSLPVLDSLDFDIDDNEFCTLIGPSGCGKTTLLRILSGLDNATSGSIDIEGPARSVSYIFQDTILFPWLTVRDNILLGLKHKYDSKKKLDEVIRTHLQKVGLEKFGNFYPGNISGGMQKRAAIARAISLDPDIIFMDEPFVHLDAQTRFTMLNLVLDLYQENRTTVVFVTHDIREAVLLSSKIIVLSALPSRVKGIVDVPFGYPRKLDDVLASDGFHEIYAEIDSLLKVEVEKSMRLEEEKIFKRKFRKHHMDNDTLTL